MGVVEAREYREALKWLMAEQSYRVVCDVASTAAVDGATLSDEPKLVILGAQLAAKAVTEAAAIRELWPDSKILLLYEHASPADLQKLLTSQIDGCVPLFASPDTLIGTLDMVVIRNVRAMVVADAKLQFVQPAQPDESNQSDIKLQSDCVGHGNVSASVGAVQHTQRLVTLQNHPKLSKRETQILVCLAKGYANRMIANVCDIAEATVKSHMKSIMRKIRVENRTQAALWAMENGYFVDELR